MLEKGLDVGGEAGPAACIAVCNTCGPQRAAPPEEASEGKATPTELPDDGQRTAIGDVRPEISVRRFATGGQSLVSRFSSFVARRL